MYHIHGIGYRAARSGILGVAIGIDYQLLTGQYEAHLLSTALHEHGVSVSNVLHHDRKAQRTAVRLYRTVGVGLDIARSSHILGNAQGHATSVSGSAVVCRAIAVLHKAVAGVVRTYYLYLHLASVGTGSLHTLVCVLVAATAYVDAEQLSCGLADVK